MINIGAVRVSADDSASIFLANIVNIVHILFGVDKRLHGDGEVRHDSRRSILPSGWFGGGSVAGAE